MVIYFLRPNITKAGVQLPRSLLIACLYTCCSSPFETWSADLSSVCVHLKSCTDVVIHAPEQSSASVAGATAKPHLKPQAPEFKPKQAASVPPVSATSEQTSTARGSAEAMQHETLETSAAVTDSPAGPQPQSDLTAATAVKTSPAKKQPDKLPPAGATKGPATSDTMTAVQISPAKPAASSTPAEHATAAISVAPVEDLDALHTEQVCNTANILQTCLLPTMPAAETVKHKLNSTCLQFAVSRQLWAKLLCVTLACLWHTLIQSDTLRCHSTSYISTH